MLAHSCLNLELVDEQLDKDGSLDRLPEDSALAAMGATSSCDDHEAAVGEELERYASQRFWHDVLLSMKCGKKRQICVLRWHKGAEVPALL
jgi:hypothetical protein